MNSTLSFLEPALPPSPFPSPPATFCTCRSLSSIRSYERSYGRPYYGYRSVSLSLYLARLASNLAGMAVDPWLYVPRRRYSSFQPSRAVSRVTPCRQLGHAVPAAGSRRTTHLATVSGCGSRGRARQKDTLARQYAW